LIEAKRQFQVELRQAYEEYKNEIFREAHEAIITACEEINQKIMETGEKVTEATLKKPRRIIDDYMTVASIFDLGEVKAEVAKLKDQLDGVVAKDIRNDWGVAKEFASNLKALGESIGDLSGYNREGRVKRQVRQVA
jgi:NAD-specific glutamate dehydrogenase